MELQEIDATIQITEKALADLTTDLGIDMVVAKPALVKAISACEVVETELVDDDDAAWKIIERTILSVFNFGVGYLSALWFLQVTSLPRWLVFVIATILWGLMAFVIGVVGAVRAH